MLANFYPAFRHNHGWSGVDSVGIGELVYLIYALNTALFGWLGDLFTKKGLVHQLIYQKSNTKAIRYLSKFSATAIQPL
jgi:hypothetical protein